MKKKDVAIAATEGVGEFLRKIVDADYYSFPWQVGRQEFEEEVRELEKWYQKVYWFYREERGEN